MDADKDKCKLSCIVICAHLRLSAANSCFSVCSVPPWLFLFLRMLIRILEPEIMDSADDAREYDAMDHSAVNEQFVTDLLATLTASPLRILDLGAGTSQIPIELARRALN